MLTATYSLVTLSLEQNDMRVGLSRLQQTILGRFVDSQRADRRELESAADHLASFDRYCHERKVEKFVIPVVRRVTCEADALLDELDSLSAQGLSLLRTVRSGAFAARGQGIANLDEMRCAMDQYCSNLYKRLAREEELLRIARRVISGEQWFALAADFLRDDSVHGRRILRQTLDFGMRPALRRAC